MPNDFIIHLGGFLPPPTKAHHEAGYRYLLEYHKFVSLELTQSYKNQLEFDFMKGLSIYAEIWTVDS